MVGVRAGHADPLGQGCYHNHPTLDATTEVLPTPGTEGQPRTFLELDTARYRVTFHVLTPAPTPGHGVAPKVGVRIWAGREYQLTAKRVAHVVLTSGGTVFHGAPSVGTMTMALWRAEWSPPPQVQGAVYYAPWIRAPATPGATTGTMQYLVRQAPPDLGATGRCAAAGWPKQDQLLADRPVGADYVFAWTHPTPVAWESMEALLNVLREHPPTWAHDPVREQAFLDLDDFLEAAIRPGRRYDLRQASQPVWQLVDERLQAALAEAAAPARAPGRLTVWQMYNMGLLARAGDAVIGMDLLPSAQASPDFNRRVASLLQALLISHGHSDHYDRDLVRACLGQGCPVWMPSSLAGEWEHEPLVHPVDEYRDAETNGLRIVARRGVHVWAASRKDPHTVYYEVTFASGPTLLFCGDLDYTRELERTPGREVDLLVLPWRSPSALYEPGDTRQVAERPVAVRAALQVIRPRYVLYSHYAELHHVYGGCPASYAIAADLKRNITTPSEWMFWGERLELPGP